MKKKKNLSKSDVFYIQQNPDLKTAEELADELNIELESVSAVYVEVKPEEKRIKEKTLLEKLMGQRGGATVLTGAAEKLAEDLKKERRGMRNDPDYVFRPKG